MSEAITRTNLNDWVRGTTTHKVMASGLILFIARDAEGFSLYTQASDRAAGVPRGVFGTEAEARRYADANASRWS